MTSAAELYKEGKLSEAITQLQQEIKANPAETSKRAFLVELLCFAGEFERADKQIDIVATQEPEALVGLGFWRQLIRAELSRQELYSDGRAPNFVNKPTEIINDLMQASICLREEKYAEALKITEAAEEKRTPVKGQCNGEDFDDFRDLDDLNSNVLEVLANNGNYYWIDFNDINSIEFFEPQRPIDLLWRKAALDVNDGPDGEVFIPTIYINSKGNELAQLGRLTEWTEETDRPLRGIGLRSFLVGDELKTILDIKDIVFNK